MVDIFDPATGKITKSTDSSTVNVIGDYQESPLQAINRDQVAEDLKKIQGDLDRFQAGLNKNALDRARMEQREAAKFTGDGLDSYLEGKAKSFIDYENKVIDAVKSHVRANTAADDQGVEKIAYGMSSQAKRQAEQTLEIENVRAVLGTMPKIVTGGKDASAGGHGVSANLKAGELKK